MTGEHILDLGLLLKHHPAVPEMLGVVFDRILKVKEEITFKLYTQAHPFYYIFLGISETREWLQNQGLYLKIMVDDTF